MVLRVLHCYADYRWTGPSEPVAVLCRELSRSGVDCELACARTRTYHNRYLHAEARRMGLAVHDGFYFDGAPNLAKNSRDIRALARMVAAGGYSIVHAHGSWDHVLAAAALRRSRHKVPLLRTDHGARQYSGSPLQRLQFGPLMTDHLIVLSDGLRARALDRLGLAPGAVTTVRGAVDVGQYRPAPAAPAIRRRFGLSDGDVAFMLVAHVQRHRRFDVLLEAAQTVRTRDRRVKILVMGRGTQKAEILDRPLLRMGLSDTVLPIGYYLDDYREVLSVADAGLMLVPGSDGSCRAAMQMAAMGRPLVVSALGALPDVVADGQTGIVVRDGLDDLAEAILEMAQSPDRRRQWGSAARDRMVSLFSLGRQARAVTDVYLRLLDRA